MWWALPGLRVVFLPGLHLSVEYQSTMNKRRAGKGAAILTLTTHASYTGVCDCLSPPKSESWLVPPRPVTRGRRIPRLMYMSLGRPNRRPKTVSCKGVWNSSSPLVTKVEIMAIAFAAIEKCGGEEEFHV